MNILEIIKNALHSSENLAKTLDTKLKTDIVKAHIKGKATRKKLVQYGFETTGEILAGLGSTTVDDKLIVTLVSAVIVAAATELTGPVGTAIGSNLTVSALAPVLEGVFKYIDEKQVQVGKKLEIKAEEIKNGEN